MYYFLLKWLKEFDLINGLCFSLIKLVLCLNLQHVVLFYAVNKAEFFILDEMIYKADPKFEILDVYRNIDSFSKASEYRNKKAAKMVEKKRSGK